jgi:hypothetical protein
VDADRADDCAKPKLGDTTSRLLFSGLVEAALVLVGEFAGAGSEREDQDEEQQ